MNYEGVKLLGGDEDMEETEEESAPEGTSTSSKAKKVRPGCELRTIVPPTPEPEVKEEKEEGAFSSS